MSGSAVRLPRVVLVEDDADVRQSVASMLTFEGYEVETFGSGKAVVAETDLSQRPAVVVLDLCLRDMTGGRCLTLIRASRWSDVPVLIFSGWGDLERFGLDAQGLVSKACDPESVARAVDRLARLTGAAGASRSSHPSEITQRPSLRNDSRLKP